MARVLLYNFSEDSRRRTVKEILFRFGIPSREIPADRQGAPLGRLLELSGFEGKEEAPEKPFTEEMIVLHDLSARQFHGFLDEMRRRGIRVPLKAAVTEENVHWSSFRLCRELQAEHEALAGKTEGRV